MPFASYGHSPTRMEKNPSFSTKNIFLDTFVCHDVWMTLKLVWFQIKYGLMLRNCYRRSRVQDWSISISCFQRPSPDDLICMWLIHVLRSRVYKIKYQYIIIFSWSKKHFQRKRAPNKGVTLQFDHILLREDYNMISYFQRKITTF